MMAASHRLGGATAGMVAAGILTEPENMAGKLVIVSASIFGSLIPDIDHPQSSISRKNRILSAAISILQLVF